jgi:capsular exopolysaccharide synthesis family protein
MFSRLRRNAKKETKAFNNRTELLVTVWEPLSVASEAYRNLRTRLLHAQVDFPPKIIALTGPSLGEGKSTTCANLGVTLAEVDKRTMIVDCDFRNPAIHKIFRLDNTFGLVDVLARERSLEEVWHEPRPKLKVVTPGPQPPDPTGLLSSRYLTGFLNQVREEFDYVLVDVPPVLAVADAKIIAAQSDGVLLVLDAQNTRKANVRRSVSSLRAVGATVLGTVMNNVERSSADQYVEPYSYVEPYRRG